MMETSSRSTRSRRPLRRALLVSLALVALALPLPASAHADPLLSVPPAHLAGALSCPEVFSHPDREPVLLVHGTFATGEENWSWNYGLALPTLGFDVCTLDLPNRALDDIQVSAEYVVHAIRTVAARAGRPVDVLAISQSGLEARWAVRWWRSARRSVDDLVMLATPNHGTLLVNATLVVTGGWCFPACLQMRQGSAFIAALNAGDETPGKIDYTSVYSLTDELVYPAAPQPTAALEGASNILVQDLCPGRPVEHVAFT
ncbi:MAG: esterase/lipase family protein, partial [Actinomycetota bacterium]